MILFVLFSLISYPRAPLSLYLSQINILLSILCLHSLISFLLLKKQSSLDQGGGSVDKGLAIQSCRWEFRFSGAVQNLKQLAALTYCSHVAIRSEDRRTLRVIMPGRIHRKYSCIHNNMCVHKCSSSIYIHIVYIERHR